MSVHNGFVKPTVRAAMACRYCGLSPTYCTCDRFLDARATQPGMCPYCGRVLAKCECLRRSRLNPSAGSNPYGRATKQPTWRCYCGKANGYHHASCPACGAYIQQQISISSSPEGRAKPGMAGTLLPEKAVAIPRECAPAGIKPGLDVDSFRIKKSELFQPRTNNSTRKGPRQPSVERCAIAPSIAADSRVSCVRKAQAGFSLC